MKRLLMAPVCITALAYAVLATNSAPRTTLADEATSSTPKVVDRNSNDGIAITDDPIETQAVGADVAVGSLAAPFNNGTLGGITGYSIGTTACNVGTVNLNWIQNSTLHPVICQNIYRINGNGIFEQLGQGWLKHSFCALQQPSLCGGTCPGGGGCLSLLQPNCSDPYTSVRNGEQDKLGPRFEVNPYTGVFPWPHTARGVLGNAIYKRIQVAVDDLNPALNPGAVYIGEGQYVARDDSLAGNQFNNASWRRITVGSLSGGGYNLSVSGSTMQMQAGIQAWPVFVPGASVQDVFVPGEGLLHVGHYVRDNGDGTWHYEYAVHNQNSDLCVGGVSVAAPNATLSNIGFLDVPYHSGEPFDGTDWPGSYNGTSVSWATTPFATNSNANAIRWGTVYNFRFDATTPPVNGAMTLTMFKNPGITINVDVPVPAGASNCGTCGDSNCDGIVTPGDIAAFVAAVTGGQAGWEAWHVTNLGSLPSCDYLCANDTDGNDVVTAGDIAAFVAALSGTPCN